MTRSAFENKTIFITGAAGGLGQSLIDALLPLNAKVWVSDIRVDSFGESQERAKKWGQKLSPLAVDVTHPSQIQNAAQTILDVEGRIDVWINNAGVNNSGNFLDQAPETFDRTLDINLKGVVTGTRVALKAMEHQGTGTIVNIASVAGHISPPFMSAYAASKHAVVGFTRSLQEELRLKSSPLKVILVSPGFVDTAILAKGESLGFPPWLEWCLSKPSTVSEAILKAIVKGTEEISPTMNGKTMLGLHKLFPKTTRKSAKLLLARSFRDAILARYRMG